MKVGRSFWMESFEGWKETFSDFRLFGSDLRFWINKFSFSKLVQSVVCCVALDSFISIWLSCCHFTYLPVFVSFFAMQFFFIYAALLILPFAAFAEQLRKEIEKTPSPKFTSRKNLMVASKIGTQTIVGSFPATPNYISVLLYDGPQCSGEVNSVRIRMIDTCFTNGVVSEKWSCGKNFIFRCFQPSLYFSTKMGTPARFLSTWTLLAQL
jgi:hypothetical protein